MKHRLGFWFFALAFAGANAQTSIEGVNRQQLQEKRTAEEARFLVLEEACYERFAVNDCLRQVRAKRRAVFDELRRHEVLLNDIDRRKKAAEQLDLIKDKTSPQKLEEAQSRRLESVKAQDEREANAEKKKLENSLAPLPNSQDKRAKPQVEATRSAEEALNKRLDFERKLKEAQDRRDSRAKSLLEKKTDKPVKPLPLE
jgi:hypothetical protein